MPDNLTNRNELGGEAPARLIPITLVVGDSYLDLTTGLFHVFIELELGWASDGDSDEEVPLDVVASPLDPKQATTPVTPVIAPAQVSGLQDIEFQLKTPTAGEFVKFETGGPVGSAYHLGNNFMVPKTLVERGY